MKKIWSAVAVFSLILMLGFKPLGNEPIKIGSKIPLENLKMLDVSGKQISLKESTEFNGLLVMFSCNTCPYVIKNQARTLEIANFAKLYNVGVVLINSNEGQRGAEDSYQAMQAYAKSQKYNFSYVVDKDNVVADAFGATRTPEVFLFKRDQTLAYHGAIDDNPSDASNVSRNHLKIAIEQIAENLLPSVTESKSVGCIIKRLKKD